MPPKAAKATKGPGPSQLLIRPALQHTASPSRAVTRPTAKYLTPVETLDTSTLKSEIAQAVAEDLRAVIKSELHDMKVEIIRDFTALKTEVSTLKSTVSDMEHSLTTYSGDVLALQAKVELLTKEVSALDAKCDDLESRSRRQNIRIVGVPEGETFSLTSSAVSELLRQAFDLDKAPAL